MFTIGNSIATRKIRVALQDPQTGNQLSVAAIEIRAAGSTTNLATTTGNASCSSHGTSPGQAADGNAATLFTIDSTRGWWQYDLGTLTEVATVTVIAPNSASYAQAPTKIAVSYLDETGRFVPVASVANLTWSQGSSNAVHIDTQWGELRLFRVRSQRFIASIRNGTPEVEQPPPDPVSAAFSVSTNAGTAPLTVNTTNTSSGATAYDWDWGDGSSHSASTSPSHTYTSPGNYTITLTATGTSGQDQATASIAVTAPAAGPINVVYSTASNRTNPQSLAGKSFTAAQNIYVLVPEQSGPPTIQSVAFYIDNATPSAPTGPATRTESVAPFDYAGTAADTTANPLNTSALANGSHNIAAVATFSDASTKTANASFSVSISTPTGLPTTKVTPLGYTRTKVFEDHFNAVTDVNGAFNTGADGYAQDIDRNKWITGFCNWGGAENAVQALGRVWYDKGVWNGGHFWCDRKFNGSGLIAPQYVYNPFVFDTPSVLKIRTTKLAGAQLAAYQQAGLGALYKGNPAGVYATGWLSTNNRFHAKHFYSECRCKLPRNAGCWPAFWMLPYQPVGGYGQNPEIDTMEYMGGANTGLSNRYSMTIHLDDAADPFTYFNHSNLSDGTWHTFGFEWDATRWVHTFDGAVVSQGNCPPSMDSEHHMILTMQVGGNWWYNDYRSYGGNPSSNVDCDPGPYDWEIDYVVAYK